MDLVALNIINVPNLEDQVQNDFLNENIPSDILTTNEYNCENNSLQKHTSNTSKDDVKIYKTKENIHTSIALKGLYNAIGKDSIASKTSNNSTDNITGYIKLSVYGPRAKQNDQEYNTNYAEVTVLIPDTAEGNKINEMIHESEEELTTVFQEQEIRVTNKIDGSYLSKKIKVKHIHYQVGDNSSKYKSYYTFIKVKDKKNYKIIGTCDIVSKIAHNPEYRI